MNVNRLTSKSITRRATRPSPITVNRLDRNTRRLVGVNRPLFYRIQLVSPSPHYVNRFGCRDGGDKYYQLILSGKYLVDDRRPVPRYKSRPLLDISQLRLTPTAV
jgi:hypothetical protein